jgi:hypothetical protein
MSFKLDLSRFGSCAAHFARIEQRPSVQKLIAYEQRVLESFVRAA